MQSKQRLFASLYTYTCSRAIPFYSIKASSYAPLRKVSSLSLSTLSARVIRMSSTSSTSSTPSSSSSTSAASTSTPATHVHTSSCTHHTTDKRNVDTEELFGRIRRSIEKEAKNMFPKPNEGDSPTEEVATEASKTESPRSQNSAYKSPSPSAYTVIHPGCVQTSDSSELQNLFDNNRLWAHKMETEYPGFFNGLRNQQKPKYMWIGCSDSRVPATEITGLMPGEIFVHRNVANVVLTTDLNLLSCLQIAIDILKVEHIIVCGHYGCAGIYYALTPRQLGISDYWIRSIKDVARHHADRLAAMETDEERHALLSELNVMEQVHNVCHTPIVQDAWRRNQPLNIHGWIYGVGNGLLKNLVNPSIKGFDQVSPAYHFDRMVDLK